MKLSPASTFSVLLGCILMFPWQESQALDPKPTPLPEEAITSFLAAQNFPLLPVAEKCRWSKDRLLVWERWSDRVLVAPFERGLKVAPEVKEEAVKFVKEGIRQLQSLPTLDPAVTPEELVKQAEKLAKAGVGGPLFSWLRGWAVYESTSEYSKCSPHLEAALKEAGPYLKYRVLLTKEELREDARLKAEMLDAQIYDAAMATVEDAGIFGEGDDEVFLESMRPLFGDRLSNNRDRMKKMLALSFKSEWVRLMLEGAYEESLGWASRGTGWASSVTEEGWRGFEEHVANARECYYAAWRMHPGRPQPAAELIGVMMVGHGADLGDAREWLDRTLAVEGDYYPALRAYLYSLYPRWGGSHEQMLALGLACALSPKEDTGLPWFFFIAIQRILNEDKDWKSVLRDPLVKPVLLELCKRRVRLAKNAKARANACSELGLLAWACEDFKLSVEAYADAPYGPSRLARRWVGYMDETEDIMRGQSVLFAAGLRKPWEDAVKHYEEGDLDQAEQLAGRILPQTTGDGAAIVERLIEASRFEKELAGGGWVPLQVDPGLRHWRIHKGKWEVSPDGALAIKGAGDSAFILYNGRVGNQFELRGRFEVVAALERQAGLGVAVCQSWREGTEYWITCLQQDSKSASEAWVLNRYFQSTLKPVPVEANAHKGTFEIRCQNDRLTYVVNGKMVYEGVQVASKKNPEQIVPMLPDGRVGFCHYRFAPETETRVYEVQVRKLP